MAQEEIEFRLKLEIMKKLKVEESREMVEYAEKMNYLSRQTNKKTGESYLWYMDDRKEFCVRISDGMFLCDYDINKALGIFI